MSVSFVLLATLTIVSAVAAMSLRNLVHCALALTVALGGLAMVYLQLGAQFVGFAQILVYIGAVGILIVFAILLTQGNEARRRRSLSSTWALGVGVAVIVFGVLASIVLTSPAVRGEIPPAPNPTVRQIGDQLMTRFILPLEVTGLLLTAALIGAVVIALHEREPK